MLTLFPLFVTEHLTTKNICYLKHLNAPHSRVQGEAMRSLQVFSHQRDPILSTEVAHVNSLHRRLQHIELEVDPIDSEVLDTLDGSSQNLLNVTPIVVGRVHLAKG